MKRSHFTSEQIMFALRQAESGTPVTEVCLEDGYRRADFLSLLEEEVYRHGYR